MYICYVLYLYNYDEMVFEVTVDRIGNFTVTAREDRALWTSIVIILF